ncbi:MAG: lysoplasmalogenase, partial [Chloroflexota bacterium]
MIILSLLAGITAVLAIYGRYHHKQSWVYLFKPTTTGLIILLALWGAVTATAADPGAYAWLIVAGLILGLAGDVFLMLPERYFLPGLGSFLAGHWFYIAAFTAGVGLVISWWLLPLLLVGGLIYGLLHSHLGRMRLPVIFYVVTILLMAGQALGRWSLLDTTGALLAAAGSLLFVISDAALALNRFRRPFSWAPIVVLSTYWAAQWLIAMSLFGHST